MEVMVVSYPKELFPTKASLAYFTLYVFLNINAGILVTYTKKPDNTYSYNTVTVILLNECLKLVAAVTLFLKHGEGVFHYHFKRDELRGLTTFANSLAPDMTPSNSESDPAPNVLLLNLVPAALYCLCNNLQFVNLAHYDPTTLYVLTQLRVVVTGIIFQIVFKRKLSGAQWVSLLCLTLGCIVKEYGRVGASSGTVGQFPGLTRFLDVHLGLVLLQIICSCFAGVYTEYLLKDTGRDVNIMTQNAFMYVDSILCNVCVLAYRGQLAEAFTVTSMRTIFQGGVICLMLNHAALGIVVSLFIRSMNSIVKVFAGVLQPMFMAVLSWCIFGTAVDANTVVAIAIVSVAIVLYAQNPVFSKEEVK